MLCCKCLTGCCIYMHVASICFKCSRCFILLLQVSHLVVSYVSGANTGMHVTTRSVYEFFFWQSSLVFRKSEVETRISLVVFFLLVGDGEGQTTAWVRFWSSDRSNVHHQLCMEEDAMQHGPSLSDIETRVKPSQSTVSVLVLVGESRIDMDLMAKRV